MGNLQEEMIINIKSSTCEEEGLPKKWATASLLKNFEFGKTSYCSIGKNSNDHIILTRLTYFACFTHYNILHKRVLSHV